MNMDAYLLVLQGQGDEYATLVDKETWDWINSPPPKNRTSNGWSELSIMPKWIRDACKKSGDDPCITIGSYQNDRALVASMSEGNGIFADMDSYGASEKNARQFAEENGYTIVAEYEGCIY